MAALFAGAALWFMRYRFDRKEPSAWFFGWLVTAAAGNAFSAASWWVGDYTVSKWLYVATNVCLMGAVFLFFAFMRSFSIEAGYMLLFWSVPLMFGAALVIYDLEALFVREGRGWVPKGFSAPYAVHALLLAFYVLWALYYAVMTYAALRRHAQKQELHGFRFILGGLVVTFISVAAGSWLRMSVNADLPAVELGDLVGALLIFRGVAGPRLGSVRAKRIKGEA